MPWYIASFPWLVILLAAWLVTGLGVARGLLRLRDGLEVAALALPVGLLSHVLVANALGRVMFLPFALFWLVPVALLLGGLWLARAGPAAPLQWETGRRTRVALLGLAVALGLAIL